MPSREINDLCTALRPVAEKFLAGCKEAGVNAFLTCTYRSNVEQTSLYAQGRSKAGKIVTNAKAGQSAHNCVNSAGKPAARAFDFAIKDETGKLDWNAGGKRWVTALALGKSLGLVSGGDWKIKDYPHFELPDWKNDGMWL
jgi:peptidoglycan L-alanyl-D-glutamate endopeptidase CwlK